MDALILWLLLLKVRITAMARTQGFPLVFLSAFFICVLQGAGGAIFEIQNNCRFTVWAAGSSSGGKRLDSGQSWRVQVANGTGGRFWGRTGCSFNGNGRGSCNTGDCGGLLNCQGSGNPPATMVYYSLNQHQNSVFYYISLVDGFNLPMSFIPSNSSCDAVTCTSNISAICPSELMVSDGCDSACTRFNTSQYCCTDKYLNNCAPTNYSLIFARQCPEAYCYAMDDTMSTSTCPRSTDNRGGNSNSPDYKVVFCGNATSLQELGFRCQSNGRDSAILKMLQRFYRYPQAATMSTMKFCREWRLQKTIVCTEMRFIMRQVSAQILQDVASDPTLPRTKTVQCIVCNDGEAVFFQEFCSILILSLSCFWLSRC